MKTLKLTFKTKNGKTSLDWENPNGETGEYKDLKTGDVITLTQGYKSDFTEDTTLKTEVCVYVDIIRVYAGTDKTDIPRDECVVVEIQPILDLKIETIAL